jgi:hypothetical protein
MKLKVKMKMYPPRVKLTVKVDPSLPNFKCLIKIEGCLDEEDLDTELIFPLESPLNHKCKLICMTVWYIHRKKGGSHDNGVHIIMFY